MSDHNLVCSTRQEGMEAGFDEPIMFDRLQDTFYPGNIIDASTIPSGAYEQVRADRVPLNLFIDPMGMSIDGSVSKIVENPSRSNVLDATIELRDRLDPGAGEGAAQMDFSMQDVQTEEMTRVFLGAHYSDMTVDVDAEFEYDAESQTHEIIAKFRQVYYSIDVDMDYPGAFFMDGRTPDPHTAIVNKVNYGRLMLFSFKTEKDHRKIEAELEAEYSKGTRDAGVEAEYEDEELEEETQIDVTVFGGSADVGGDAITVEGPSVNTLDEIHEVIRDGASYGPDHPGVPISYQLTYLSDGSDAGVTTASDYTVRECAPVTNEYRVHDFAIYNYYDATSGRSSTENVDGQINIWGVYEEDGEEVDKERAWYPGEGSRYEMERADQNDIARGEHDERVLEGFHEDPGKLPIDAEHTVTFSDVDRLDENEAGIVVWGSFAVDGDNAGEEALMIPLDDVTSIDHEARLMFAKHRSEPLAVKFKVSPVVY